VNELNEQIGGRLLTVLNRYKTEWNSVESNKRFGKVEFARSINVDPSQFSKILKGAAGLSLESLLEISSKYAVDLNWLITGKEKSGSLDGMPDSEVLTQLKKDVKVLLASLQRLDEKLPALPDPGKTPLGTEGFQRGADKSEKIDKF
jgi:transcriptional regulator with XRE-family HTH domain